MTDEHDDAFPETWSDELRRSLEDETLAARLPGLPTPKQILDLHRQLSPEAAAAAQATMTETQRAEKTMLDDRYWEAVGLPVTAGRYRNPIRPEVVAQFAAVTVVKDRRASSSSFWIVSGYLSWTAAGDFVAEQLTVGPMLDGPGVLTPAVLRAISVPGTVARVRAAMQLAPEFASFVRTARLARDAQHTEELEAEAAALAAVAESPPIRGGRLGYPDELYRWVANHYLDLQAAGVGRGILIRLAELASVRLGRTVSRENMRDWVKRCRELGFLEEHGHQGKAGALPGPRLQTRRRARSAPEKERP